MSQESGLALKDFLSDPYRSYNFDDIDILEGFREFSRAEVRINLSGRFSKNIHLKIPFATAPMPDVTDEHILKLASLNGGIGINPYTNDPEQQAEINRKVKKFETGFLEQPFTLQPNNTISAALAAPYSNIPIVSSEKLVGLFVRQKYGEYFYRTSGNILISEVMEKDFSHIAAPLELVQVNGELNFLQAQRLMEERKIPALVIVGSKLEFLYLVTMKDVAAKEIYPDATRDSKNRLGVGAAILEYMTEENLDRIRKLAEAEVDVLVIEQAHAWNEDVGRMTRYLKNEYPHIDVVVGNDSVAAAVDFHLQNGADGCKIGQGPGAACLTGEQDVIGIWRPQFSAVYDCANRAVTLVQEKGKEPLPCIADGGIKTAYDAFKTLAAGAESFMVGKIVAQCKDSPAQEIEPGKKLYCAMGSKEIVEKFSSASKRYNPRQFVAEGKALILDVTEPFEEFLKKFVAKLCRSFERVGAQNIAELHQKLRDGTLRAQLTHDRSTR